VIVLDTNVVSALMREAPDTQIVKWLDQQAAESIWITSITHFEARFGLALLPKGKRRQTLEAAFDDLVSQDLEGRVLNFDQPAAESAAQLAANRQRAGLVIDMRDTQIAGIVVARRATLATRNIKHFADLDIALINPWESNT
jgi:toxin FitB